MITNIHQDIVYTCFHRWLCYCQVPVFCDSLQKYDPTAVFGRALLRSVFSVMRRQLLEKFRAEKDKMPPDKRTIVLTHFPRFVTNPIVCTVWLYNEQQALIHYNYHVTCVQKNWGIRLKLVFGELPTVLNHSVWITL